MKRRSLLQLAASGAALSALPFGARAANLEELRLDYAYYSPTSLVLRHFGWLEEAFKADGTRVKWVLSAGSNRALEYLNANSIDIGSSAGLAALLAKANGNPIRTPYIYSRPEWTALVVPKHSPIRTLADLKGKKVAATKGTDPYLFLLRALHTAGLRREGHRTRQPAARGRPRRAGTGPRRCLGRPRSAHGRQRTRRRRAPAVPERGLQHLRLPERARGIPGGATAGHGARDPGLRTGAHLDPRQSGGSGEDPVERGQGLAAGGAAAGETAQRLFNPQPATSISKPCRRRRRSCATRRSSNPAPTSMPRSPA